MGNRQHSFPTKANNHYKPVSYTTTTHVEKSFSDEGKNLENSAAKYIV